MSVESVPNCHIALVTTSRHKLRLCSAIKGALLFYYLFGELHVTNRTLEQQSREQTFSCDANSMKCFYQNGNGTEQYNSEKKSVHIPSD